MFSVNRVSVHFSGEYILDDISFLINSRDRIGLVGKNGTGKTTLLRIIKGELKPESGNIVIPSGKTIGYLPQELTIASNLCVLDEALTAFRKAMQLKEEISRLTGLIHQRDDFHSADYLRLIDRLNHANEEFMLFGGNTMQADSEKVLLGLGFKTEDFIRNMKEFSGGWQMRVEIAKILLSKPDLILLDEPTNHLDIESIQWLEDFLSSYPGAVILVSHDRAFLDNVTNRTVEISLGKVFDYKACYSDYVVMREERHEQQVAAFNNQQRQIAQIESFVSRFRYKATKARQVQSRLKLLDKIDRVEIDETDASSIHFRFPPAPQSGKVCIEARQVAKRFGDQTVLSDVSFAITRGEKVAFVGRNGEGKTTLSRIIVGELEHEGELERGYNVRIGYFAQNQSELLNMEKTVFQTIDDAATGEMRPRVRGLLGSFLFEAEAMDKKVKVLSGGEKSRLAIARLLLEPINLLVLDEPTNHLDMVSKDILKNALLKYNGTLIVVSHDRDFLQGLTDKVFEFRHGRVMQYIGDIYSFLDSRRLQTLQQLELRRKEEKSTGNGPVSDSKLQYEKKKEFDKNKRKLLNQQKKFEEMIAQAEKEIAGIDQVLSNPHEHTETISNNDLYSRYQHLKQELEHLMEQWSSVATRIDELDNTGQGHDQDST